MRFYIKPNFDKPAARACAIESVTTLLEISKRLNVKTEIFFDENDANLMGALEGAVFSAPERVLPGCDVVISIGGDGTIIRAAKTAARAGKPVLGINAGRLGFLTQLESHELNELERLFTGRYRIFNRMMLEAGTKRAGAVTALNDVVIRHGDSDRIVSVEVRQGERLIAAHRADGVIFSTPTGSTAYSMSAGGPVVSPELELILVTAICPHSAFNCPLALPTEPEYTAYETGSGNQGGMYVSVDGMRVDRLEPGEPVKVRRSDIEAKFIDFGLREFFSNLNQKLSWRK